VGPGIFQKGAESGGYRGKTHVGDLVGEVPEAEKNVKLM